MRRPLPLVVALAAALLLPSLAAGGARAQRSNALSLYTEDGVEIGVDARVFALFAMLNALGYDEDSLRGAAPVRKPLHTSARQKARQSLGRPGPALRALEALMAKNPAETSVYVAAVLELGPAPNFEDKGASPLAKAIAQPLRDWFNAEGGAQVLRVVGEEQKPTQKKLLPLLDKAVKATTALVRLGDAQDQLLDDTGAQGRVVLVLNELDSHGTLQRVQRGDVTYVVVGPPAAESDEAQIVDAVVAAYARTLVVREADKAARPGSLVDTSALSPAVRSAIKDEKGYASELLACAFLRQVRGQSAGCAGSPLEREPGAATALDVLAPRIDAFARDSAVLGASMEKLLEPAPAAPAPAPAPEADGKGKKGKAAGKGG
jgi:hypothetical protein